MIEGMPDSTEPHPNADVRMRGFRQRSTVEAALDWLNARLDELAWLPSEAIPVTEAAGRILHTDVASQIDVPQFRRAMMDGYAVQAADTHGASPYNRLALKVIGQCLPGQRPASKVSRGQALRIMTGAATPPGADAILPAEKAECDGEQIYALASVAAGKHIGEVGEDVGAGQLLFSSGRRLRPQDVGLLAAVGRGEVDVVRRPRVRIVVTGNELLPPGEMPRECRIVDANGPMLGALVARDGALAINPGIVPDEAAAIDAALGDDADVILVSGGSSVGQEDYVPTLLAERGELAIHGIAMRPSSPAGFGQLDQRLVFLLPGNPTSCLCAYDFFAARAIRSLGGLPRCWPYRKITASARRKLASVVGRLDYARVRLVDGDVEPLAVSGASVLSSATRADGFVVIPADSEGYGEGESIEVHLYDHHGWHGASTATSK